MHTARRREVETMYGLSDDLRDMTDQRDKALNLLVQVAQKKKSPSDVRTWLKRKYPDLFLKIAK